jgi:hypothetical protein
MKPETFASARERLMTELTAAGWKVTTFSFRTMKPLKVPYAERGRDKLWFKPQALYWSSGPGIAVNDARSIQDDIRGINAAEVERLVRHFSGYAGGR